MKKTELKADNSLENEMLDVYQSESDSYIKMKVLGRYKYLGGLNNIDLTEGKIYYRVGSKDEFRIVDDSEEDYLYSEEFFKPILKKCK